jgi:predicted lipoprotein with Yx(FWY)xxD motif
MKRMRVAVFSTLAATGALAMTACSADTSAPAAASSQVASAASGAATADLQSLSFQNGTAQQHHAPKNTGDFFHGPRSAPQARKWTELNKSSANGLSPIVVNGAGFTLYRFDKDSPNPSTSNCTGPCLKTWPAVEVDPNSKVFVQGVPANQVGVIRRPDDGHLQLTIGRWPVYTFSGDTAPGQTNGEGVQGTWFAVSPTGQPVKPAGGVNNGASTAPGSSSSTPPQAGGVNGSGAVILDTGKNLQEPQGSQSVAGTGCQTVNPAFPAQSAQLLSGSAKLWDGPNCTGNSLPITSNVNDLQAAGFNGPVASVRFTG